MDLDDDFDADTVDAVDYPVVEESKKQKRLRWTVYEEATLIKLSGKLAVEQIASIMGRSVQSVKMRANALKLSLKNKKTVWDENKLKQLNELKSQGKSWREISKTLKCTEMSCMKVFQRTYGSRDVIVRNKVLDVLNKVLATVEVSEDIKEQIRKGVESGF